MCESDLYPLTGAKEKVVAPFRKSSSREVICRRQIHMNVYVNNYYNLIQSQPLVLCH